MRGTGNVIMIAVTIMIGNFNQVTSVTATIADELPTQGDDKDGPMHLPQIKWPADEIVLGYGHTWNVSCVCHKPIVWKPFDAEYFWDPPNINISIYNTADTKMLHKSILTITNASALMVGRYYCVHLEKQHEHLDEMIAENLATSIYVYVNDPHQLVVPEQTSYYNHGDGVVVVCKPSHPEVVMQLCEKTSKNCMGTLDPTKGFFCFECFFPEEIYCRANGKNWHTLNSNDLVVEPRKPIIKSNIGDHIPIGRTVHLTCTFEDYRDSNVLISWKILPNHLLTAIDKTISIRNQSRTTSNRRVSSLVKRDLVIENATLAHTRAYRCEVVDSENNTYYHNFKLHVRESADDFVILNTADNRKIINHKTRVSGEGTSIEIIINYKSFPTITSCEWFKGSDKIYSNDISHYRQEISENYVKLKIEQPKVHLNGNYTAVVYAGTANANYTMEVFVHDKPYLEMDSNFAFKGKTVEFECTSEAYPYAKVSFMFQPCKEVPCGNCSKVNHTAATAWLEGRMDNRFSWLSYAFYNIVADEPGIVYCRASNSEGIAVTQAYLLLQNSSSQMSLTISQPKGSITVGDNVTFICSVITFKSGVDIRFEHNGKVQHETLIYKDSNTQRKELTLWNVDRKHTGDVNCYVRYQHSPNFNDKRSIHMEVKNPIAPHLRTGEIYQNLSVEVLKRIMLECDVAGTPEPKLTWLKNGAPFTYDMSSPRNTSSITIEYANPMHSGLYECIAENKRGSITISRNVTVQGQERNLNLPILYGLATFLILLITGLLLTSLFFYKKMKQAHNFKTVVDSNFGSSIMGIVLNEQADLLPYNQKYEFPLEQLQFHTQLGSGAFGIVMMAIASGIQVHEETTTVAVKIVKDKHDDDSLRSLLAELKILTYLGRHLNVVNLLGAVTQNLSNHELMVIVEYCAFGNLQDYLQKHRGRFMDQISHQSDEVLQSNRTDRVYQYNVHGLKYVSLSFSTDNLNHPAQCGQQRTGNKGYVYYSQIKDAGTNGTEAHNTSTEKLTAQDHLSFNSDEPLKLSSHLANDPVAPLRSLNTTDLIIWAAQVASGMEYLASQKVMHGDLAARNILLCDDNVVKICDFGLARTIYRHNVYKKKGEALLPFKWLAIECIADNVFNTQSDVWAYGIALWELFSLGSAPYPGLEANVELYKMLKDGYRMEKPTYANQDIYDIMLNCWADDPHSRPTFRDLKSRFNAMMPEEMLDRLVKLNEPYLAMNAANTNVNGNSPSTSLDPCEELTTSAQDYINVANSPSHPSLQSNANLEREPTVDADRGTSSNNDEF